MAGKKPAVIQIRLGALASLQAVYDAERDVFILNISESGIVQKRTAVDLESDQAEKLARFILETLRLAADKDDPTKPR